MCDEANLEKWAREGLTRRQFGLATGMAAIAAACTPKSGQAADGMQVVTSPGFPAWTEQSVAFETPDGTMDGWLVAPTSGPAPAVVIWPDIAGLRESKKAMARRLADRGYAALVVNPYYRDVAGQQFADFANFILQEGFKKVGPWRGKLDADAITSDAKAIAGWLATRDEYDASRGIGTQGYCMGGPFTVWSVAADQRFRAAASFHGGGLVRDGEKSPHRLLRADAHYLIAIAQNDDAKTPDDKVALRAAADATGCKALIEVYLADHGWCVPDSPAYNEPEAERAWAEMLKLYGEAL